MSNKSYNIELNNKKNKLSSLIDSRDTNPKFENWR